MERSIEVYADGLFGINNPDRNEKELMEFTASKFSSYVMFALHVHSNGDLYYNDSLIISDGYFSDSFSYLPGLLNSLSKSGELWWCIGGWRVPDFSNIGALLATEKGRSTLRKNLTVLNEAIPVVGFDFDMEEYYDESMGNFLIDFAEFIVMDLHKAVSFCPYMEPQFWLNCLADIYQSYGSQLVTRFRLQCYAGGTGNTTQAWLGYMQGFERPLGISNLDSFILPSNWVTSDDGKTRNTPHDIEQFFTQFSIRSGAGGGFLWCSSEIFESGYSAVDYSNAVINGLGR